jgi:hypothetical protein
MKLHNIPNKEFFSNQDTYPVEVYHDKKLLLEALSKYDALQSAKLDYFYKNKIFRNTEDNRLYQLTTDIMNNVKFSEFNNYINSFLKVMQDEKRTMLFVTNTLPSSFRISDGDIVSTIKKQHHHLNNYFSYLNQANALRGFRYIKTFEFHKSLDVHSHTAFFVEDNFSSIKTFLDFAIRAKDKFLIGRSDIVLHPKYRQKLIKAFDLTRYGDFYYHGTREDFESGSSLLFRFFNDKDDFLTQTVKYVVKYVYKSKQFNNEENIYASLFKYLGIRVFVTSKNVLVPVTAYRKIRKDLIAFNEDFQDMYKLKKAVDAGELSIKLTYEKRFSRAYNLENEQITLCATHNAQRVIKYKEISYGGTEKNVTMIIGSPSSHSFPIEHHSESSIVIYSPFVPSEQPLTIQNHYTLKDDVFDFELEKEYSILLAVEAFLPDKKTISTWYQGKNKIHNIWEFSL